MGTMNFISSRIAVSSLILVLASSASYGAASPGLTKIYESFIVSKIAAERCGKIDADTQKKFLANFEMVSVFARKELKARFPDSTDQTVEVALKDQAAKIAERVDEIVKADGCGDEKIQKLLDAYRYHANWNAADPPKE